MSKRGRISAAARALALTGAVAAAKCSAPCDVDAGTDASDGTCAALAQCCANVPQVDTSNCQSAYASANGVDAACVDPLALYRAQGKCF